MNSYLVENACNFLIRDTIEAILATGNPDAGGTYFCPNRSAERDRGDWFVYVVRERAPGEQRVAAA